MDEHVITAMARWPDVPDVFGWLSLSRSGQWRLHSGGSAVDELVDSAQGEPIGSARINQFINHNYAQDAHGRWFFQNGPQRVYVRLDVAPFILHTIDDQMASPVFLTHNGLHARTVMRWCLDDAGHLYADTDLGAGLIAGRDVEQVLNKLTTADGDSLIHALGDNRHRVMDVPLQVRWCNGSAVAFSSTCFDSVPDLLGFVRSPQPGL